ncbi:MAG: hypothetical protein DSY80_00070 [Desulfocapsa sp.]|nr:MAG: hypothetical protein DSY80_00070 [Desulfocapsa sp.]
MKSRCKGNGCLLRDSCKLFWLNAKEFGSYTVEKGCKQYQPKQIRPVILETQFENRFMRL